MPVKALPLLFLTFTGCTVLQGRNNTHFYSVLTNHRNLVVTVDGASMSADDANTSTPVRAVGSVAGTVATGAAGVLTAGAVPGL